MNHNQEPHSERLVTPASDFSALEELPALDALSQLFVQDGYQVALTGGATRDYFLGRTSPDFDLISDAPPDESERLLASWAGSAIRGPSPFGRVSCVRSHLKVEVLTYRSPKDLYPPYDASLLFDDPLHDQLAAADLTIHAGALMLPEHRWIDPFDAVRDLRRGILATPIAPSAAILGHPSSLLRYVRFAAELGFTIEPDLFDAMTELAAILRDNWTWRCVQTLSKILALPNAATAAAIMRETTVMEYLPKKWRNKLATVG